MLGRICAMIALTSSPPFRSVALVRVAVVDLAILEVQVLLVLVSQVRPALTK